MAATILYLNTDPDAHIPQMTLAGMRRYAASRGWAAEAFSAAESRKSRLAALFRKHAPVVGCVWECTDDGLPGSPSALDGVPVVYLHASRAVPENGVRLSTDNEAVAVAAAAGKAGRPIPRELILLGVDNHVALCESASPTISSIQIGFERAGFAAAKTIARRLRSGSGGAAAPAPSILPLMTARRESTLRGGSKLNIAIFAPQ